MTEKVAYHKMLVPYLDKEQKDASVELRGMMLGGFMTGILRRRRTGVFSF